MRAMLAGALAAVAALLGIAQTAQASGCTPNPAISSATALGNSQVQIVYTGVCGSQVEVKEKRANGSGSCGAVAGCNAYYFEPNTGDVTITSIYGPGPTTFRVCDISGTTDVCSLPVPVTVT